MKRTALKAALLSTALLSMSYTAISSLIADIAKSFPGAGPEVIKSIVTLPSITIIVFSLLSGKLAAVFGKRKILLISLVMFIIGGIGPAFMRDLAPILILRAILGMGLGIIVPVSNGLIIEFIDEKERIAMFGIQSALVSIGGMLTSAAAGFLGTIRWQYAFWVYILGLAVFFLVFLYIPRQRAVIRAEHEKSVLPLSFYLLSLFIFIFNILLFAFFTNISNIIAEDQIGNAASSGTVVTFFNAAGIASGLLFSKLVKILGKFIISVILGLTGLGFAILSLTHNIAIMFAAAFFIGFSFAVLLPFTIYQINTMVQKSCIPSANAIYASAMNTGVFVSPYVFSILGRLFGNGTGRFTLLFTAICMLAACLGAVILNFAGVYRQKGINVD